MGLAGLLTSGADEVLRIVAGSLHATRGRVLLGSTSLPSGNRRSAARAGVGYLPGDRTLSVLPNHRVRENVTIASLEQYSRLGMPGVRRERRGITDALRRVGFTRSTEVIISTLSGGNQQKALFARWALEQLKVLLLDDPTIGVDVGARAEIHAELRQVAASGVGVLLYSSDIDELVSLSDRILVFDRGRCVSELRDPQGNGDRVIELMTGASHGG
ncbi:ATP-binding cassette domain-containing protein [Nocardioides sp. B-3]|nr:ATP-binding cassette domain-containing protein [Nocardioides sp. B-3]